MSKIIDLSMPITEHFRWQPRFEVKGDLRAGAQYQATLLHTSVHAFTHMDAQRHILADGPTMAAIPLERVVGDCAIVDLAGVQSNEAIDSARIAARAGHLGDNELVLLRSCWDRQHSPQTPEFWTEAPYLTRDAAEWLLAKNIRAIAYDFPQDYPIRLSLEGKTAPFDQHVTHDVLLRNGVTMIEYLCNAVALQGERTYLVALPMNIPHADGAPTRVIAIEEF